MEDSDRLDGPKQNSTDSTTTTRRTYLRSVTAMGVAGMGALAGCSGSSNSDSVDPEVPDGVPAEVQSQYWRDDWPHVSDEQYSQGPPISRTASAGAAVDPISMEYSREVSPWMQQYAFMFQEGFNQLGASTDLNNRPLNQLYAESWAPAGLEAVISMSIHGPDPIRAVSPVALLMRKHQGSPSFYEKWWHPRMQEVLSEQAITTGNEEKRVELIKEAQQIFSDDVAGIIPFFPDLVTAANTEKFEGYVNMPGNGPTRDTIPWSEPNLQPNTDETSYVKGTTTTMDTLNLPWGGGGPEDFTLRYIYDGLLDVGPDLQLVPALATDWEFIDDTTVDFELREGVQWHDGEEFTPSDVKFTVEYYTENDAINQTLFYNPVESAEVVSEGSGGTIRFNLKNPNPTFISHSAVNSVIIPEHRWEDIDTPSQHTPDPPIGTGPFQFDSWSQGSRFRVKKWDNNWKWDDEFRSEVLGDDFASGDGIDELIWSNVGNTDAMIGAINSGDIHSIDGTLSISQAERATESPAVEKFTVENFAPLDTKLNFLVPIIRDKEFRKALAHSIDNEGFVEDVLGGRATVAEGQNPASPLHSKWYNSNVEGYAYDTDKARTILEKAGYTWNNDTLHYPNGEAWGAFVERIQDGNTYKRRTDLDQPDFSSSS
ncbi:peptide/nickel transport system substrate-binding protein [Halogranum gelatinilyticum]|uniref:Peptide/nickel transport system substrate-binding protein n=2 Tax=Halogranum gelatinilyticum TaxID=660521 RepID=A0A1G9YYP0_9EURY|nr:ABC transporter substrate-binding protein [Halogranum gelatinilyticum]SDN14292.1 peptide/nickel transport system substrate-binding protein [Halogranum gelatinilyticum]